MARAGRRRDDEISVSELLRETGATPRALGGPPPETRTREDDTGEGYRERLEQRAREAAAGQQRAGRRIRWISAIGGAVVVLGSLVLIAVTSESSPERQAAVVPGPLAPATTPRPTTSGSTAPSPTPIPTVLRQTSSAAAAKPAPVATATCLVRFAVRDQWSDGFTADVTITSRGTLSPWTLTWTFTAGQRVTHGWDGKYSQSGSRVTVDAESWNTTLAPGATVSTGLNGAFDHGNPAPTAFTLNGARCDAG